MNAEKYQYMTYDQRKIVKSLLSEGESPSKVAQELGVHHATIYRELQRGCVGKPCKESNYSNYDPDLSQEVFTENIKRRGKNNAEA